MDGTCVRAHYVLDALGLAACADTKVGNAFLKGLSGGQGLAAGVAEFFDRGSEELLAQCLVIFVALVPFFAVKELGRVLGEERIRALFFRGRSADSSPPER